MYNFPAFFLFFKYFNSLCIIVIEFVLYMYVYIYILQIN